MPIVDVLRRSMDKWRQRRENRKMAMTLASAPTAAPTAPPTVAIVVPPGVGRLRPPKPTKVDRLTLCKHFRHSPHRRPSAVHRVWRRSVRRRRSTRSSWCGARWPTARIRSAPTSTRSCCAAATWTRSSTAVSSWRSWSVGRPVQLSTLAVGHVQQVDRAAPTSRVVARVPGADGAARRALRRRRPRLRVGAVHLSNLPNALCDNCDHHPCRSPCVLSPLTNRMCKVILIRRDSRVRI